MTGSIPTDLAAPGSAPSRRTLIAGAAWSVPVITMAAAAPLVAASTGVKTAVFTRLGELNADNGNGNGEFKPWVTVSSESTGEEWSTGPLTATLTLTGPWTTANIAPVGGGTWPATVVVGGITWNVDSVSPSSVTFSADSVDVTGSTTIFLPEATFTGTYEPGDFDEDNRIGMSASFAAASINSGTPTTKSLEHDGPRTVYTPLAFNAPTWTMDRAEPLSRAVTADEFDFTIGPPPKTPSNRYYRLEGVRAVTTGNIVEQQAIPAGVNNVRATLKVDPAWEGLNFVTAELWARAPFDASATEQQKEQSKSYWPTIMFSSQGGTPHVEVWGAPDSVPVAWGDLITLEIAHDPFENTFRYYLNGNQIYWSGAGTTLNLDVVLLNHQNPNHPASQSEQGTSDTPAFDVTWTDLVFGERIDKDTYTF